MSWQEKYREDYPCDCGKGTYTKIYEDDDWNRDRERVIINCPECIEKAKIAEAERKRKRDEDNARLKELITEINTYFEERYLEEWLTYFTSARNKKEAWALAKKIGIEYYSLSSFYQWNKGLSVEEYGRKLARFYNMEKIMVALNIDDSILKSKVEKAMELRNSTNSLNVY